MYDDIIQSLEGSDRVFVAPVFSAGEPNDPNYTPVYKQRYKKYATD